MEQILSSLLYKSNITTVDKKDLYLQLLSHNEYPSIKAVTDTLDYFGIENIAANVPTDALAQLPDYFLALITSNEQTELILVKKKPNKILYTDQNGKKHTLPWSDFSKLWTGTIIATEEEKQSVSSFSRVRPTSILVTLAAILAIAIVSITNNHQSTIIYLLLAGVGAIISYLTIKEELGIKDKVTTKVCGAISGDTHGCSNVINSREGKIFGVISLADGSLLFFASLFLFSALYGANNWVTYGLSILSIPMVLFSIYVQTFKLKQFCLLCLLISTVLISQFVLLQTAFSNWDFSWNEFLRYLFITSLSAFIWTVIKGFWKDSNSLNKTTREFYTFKRNSSFFLGALQGKSRFEGKAIASRFQVSFGNPSAIIKIDAVTNPLCGYCKEPFDVYDKLLTTYPDDVQLNFIFNVPTDPENKSNEIVTRILELYDTDRVMAYKSLQDWFTDRNIETWQAQYGISNSMLLIYPEKVIEAHLSWCNENKIFYTPETTINGYPFPKKEYKIADLPLFVEPIKEQFQTTKAITI